MSDFDGDEYDNTCALIDGDEAPLRRRKRKRAETIQRQVFPLLLIGCAVGGLWASEYSKHELCETFASCSGRQHFIGVCLCEWTLESRESLGPPVGLLKHVYVRGKDYVGHVAYNVLSMYTPEQVAEVETNDPFELLDVCGDMLMTAVQNHDDSMGDITLSKLYDHWRKHHGPRLYTSVMLASLRWISSFVSTGATLIHAVPFTRERAPMQKRLLYARPTVGAIKSFVLTCPSASDNDEVVEPTKPSYKTRPVEDILDWLQATVHQKSLRSVRFTKAAYESIYARALGVAAETLSSSAKAPNYELLRLARVRLDCASMLLFRHIWEQARADLLDINIWADASPQLKGKELFAASFAMSARQPDDSLFSERRLFPIINLGAHLLSALGKTFCLLWQIYLLIGPNYHRLRSFLHRVRSITTDLGAERLIRDAPDYLIEFLQWLGVRIPRAAVRERYLFPRAILQPGWHHLLDGLLRFALCTLPWFPLFLTRVKATAPAIEDAPHPDQLSLDAAGTVASSIDYSKSSFEASEALSFVSAQSDGQSGSDQDDDGEIDDLEYLTLDLVNVLPAREWHRLLELLNSREGRALDLTKENEALKAEVRSLRSSLRKQQSGRGCSISPSHVPHDPEDVALRRDLERRVAAMASERRGHVARDKISEDLKEAVAESLDFLGDANAAAQDLPKLLAMLTQWLAWATRCELAPRGAGTLLAQVPEATLQAAWKHASTLAEHHAGKEDQVLFAHLPACVPIALSALEALPSNTHVQRCGLACIALNTFGSNGRAALLNDDTRGLKQLFSTATHRSRHPEIQIWALAAIANVACDFPSDNVGAALAWETCGLSICALRNFRSAPDVLEHAARAFATMLYVQPQRSRQAALAKHADQILQELTSNSKDMYGQELLRRQLAEATKALERASTF